MGMQFYNCVYSNTRPNDDSERFLSAFTVVEEEGYQISKSTIMVVDLTSRPYFVGNLPVPELQGGQKGTNVLTLTEGIVGPIVPHFPLNITKIIGV